MYSSIGRTFAFSPAPVLSAVSRRIFLLTAAALPVDLLKSVTRARPTAAAEFITTNCRGFLYARGSTRAILWRGGDTPGICNSPSDLLDPRIYGEHGAKYFEALRNSSCPIDPSVAHIGTGNRRDAAAWGDPVSVWPIGQSFKFVYWRDRSLLYDEKRDGDGPMSGTSIARRNGPFYDVNLKDALLTGKEVMFDARQGFVVVSERDTPAVVNVIEDLLTDTGSICKPAQQRSTSGG